MANNDFIPPANPWILFKEWYGEAQKAEPNDPEAMALATAGRDGAPSVRMVLFKGYGEDGLLFLTNRESRKGDQLKENPRASVCLHWKTLRRQIRMEGQIIMATDKESDDYFATRARESRLGAWVSQQSRPLKDRATMDNAVKEFEKKFEGKDVPRPAYWGGYRLIPTLIEFWTEGRYRLHDRFVYRRKSDKDPWTIERLYP